MKNTFMLRSILCLTLACLMCLTPAFALGSGMEIKPLEETDASYFEYLLPEVNLSFFLPITVSPELVLEEPGQKALRITDPQFPDTYFLLFAIRGDHLKGLTLKGMDQKAIYGVLDMISPRASSLTYETITDFTPGDTVLRVPEGQNGSYAEHLIALKEGWVLNMMAQRLDGSTSLTKEEAEYQEEILGDALQQTGLKAKLNRYALADTGIAFTLPGTMYMHLNTDEPDRKELYVSPLKPGIQTSILHLFAIRSPDFSGRTVKDLPEAILQKAIKYPTFTAAYDAASLAVVDDFAPGVPAVRYESDGSCKHLLALRDGWALYASIYPLNESMDPVWVEKVQNALMQSMLGGSAEIPEWLPAYPVREEGEVLHFPLQNRILEVQIPKGYGVDIMRDTADRRDVFFYALDGSPNYYHIGSITSPGITGDTAIDEMYNKAELLDLCERTSQSIVEQGLKPTSTVVNGPMGVAAVRSTTKEQVLEQYFWMTDSNFLLLSFVSEDGPITKEESALLKSLIQK